MASRCNVPKSDQSTMRRAPEKPKIPQLQGPTIKREMSDNGHPSSGYVILEGLERALAGRRGRETNDKPFKVQMETCTVSCSIAAHIPTAHDFGAKRASDWTTVKETRRIKEAGRSERSRSALTVRERERVKGER